MWTDLHCHIVPQVDDGSQSVAESLSILDALVRQGINHVVATPHFYAAHDALGPYLEKIDRQYHALLAGMNDRKAPRVVLGYEVHFFKGISEMEKIEEFTIGESNFLLLELPYREIDERVTDEIEDLVVNFPVLPILAHVERYFSFGSMKAIFRMLEKGIVRGQVNASSFQDFSIRKKTVQLLQTGLCQYLGSDAHNMTSRPPQFEQAFSYLQKKLGTAAFERLQKDDRLLADTLFSM